jgi:hypothetical protein
MTFPDREVLTTDTGGVVSLVGCVCVVGTVVLVGEGVYIYRAQIALRCLLLTSVSTKLLLGRQTPDFTLCSNNLLENNGIF